MFNDGKVLMQRISKYCPSIGAASFTCSTVLPLMMAPSSNSSAQPSLSTLKTIASIPRFFAAICVLKRVRRLGFRNNKPIRLFSPSLLSTSGFALYINAFATKALMSVTSRTEINCFIFICLMRNAKRVTLLFSNRFDKIYEFCFYFIYQLT